MNKVCITSDLEAIARSDQFEMESERLTRRWRKNGIGIDIEAVQPILRFMEEHDDDDIDYGIEPSPLVNLMAQLPGDKFADHIVAPPFPSSNLGGTSKSSQPLCRFADSDCTATAHSPNTSAIASRLSASPTST